MINGAYARPIVLRSLGGTQLMCPHTNTCGAGRRWFSFSPPHSGDLEEQRERERRVHYVQQLYPFHLYCNTSHAAQRDNSLNSPFSCTQSDTFQQYPVVSLKGELGIPLQSMYQHLSWLVQCEHIPRVTV